MKTLLAGLFGMGLIVATLPGGQLLAAPQNTPPGLVNNPGLTNNPGQALERNPNLNGTRGAVPIPGTLLLFGGGFAGLVGWKLWRDQTAKIAKKSFLP